MLTKLQVWIQTHQWCDKEAKYHTPGRTAAEAALARVVHECCALTLGLGLQWPCRSGL